MRKERQLVPEAVLFGKVIAYKCTTCGRKFAISLLYGAVSTGSSPPASVVEAFYRHICEKEAAQSWR